MTTEKSISQIIEIVEKYFNLLPGEIHNITRKREIVQARQIAMYFAQIKTKVSLTQAGIQIGGKGHATVLHACKTVNNLMDTDKRFRNYIIEISKKLPDFTVNVKILKKKSLLHVKILKHYMNGSLEDYEQFINFHYKLTELNLKI